MLNDFVTAVVEEDEKSRLAIAFVICNGSSDRRGKAIFCVSLQVPQLEREGTGLIRRLCNEGSPK